MADDKQGIDVQLNCRHEDFSRRATQ